MRARSYSGTKAQDIVLIGSSDAFKPVITASIDNYREKEKQRMKEYVTVCDIVSICFSYIS